ncbi:1204_t:CDS:2, partial [Acaulospora colombiana]
VGMMIVLTQTESSLTKDTEPMEQYRDIEDKQRRLNGGIFYIKEAIWSNESFDEEGLPVAEVAIAETVQEIQAIYAPGP